MKFKDYLERYKKGVKPRKEKIKTTNVTSGKGTYGYWGVDDIPKDKGD